MFPAFVQHVSTGLLASLTSTSSTVDVTGRRVHEDTCLRFCHSPGGLLGIAEFAGLEFAGLENDGLENDGRSRRGGIT